MSEEKTLKPRITLTEGRITTTSLVLAEHFGKRHDNVLHAIERTVREISAEFNALNFKVVSYQDAKGEERRMYRLTRDGFALIAMGFTGKRAMQWKVAYINAFNAMEDALRGRESSHKALPSPEPAAEATGLRVEKERDSDLFLALFYALGRDHAAATMLWYLLGKNAHVAPFRSTYREIQRELNNVISRGAICNSTNRLVSRGLIATGNNPAINRTVEPRTYSVILSALIAQLQLLPDESLPGLADFVSKDPTRLLH
ncbi:Rha family transcriptional regulator [Paraburkholderia tropica]|uniref:Rha family transcriptional regulator n=1 Tax=Paraburkholderia tropica TaxID=92647 RepID=UPI002AB7D167|nr:Rha family transcriptional regulator [Paraburkholderia tropica]